MGFNFNRAQSAGGVRREPILSVTGVPMAPGEQILSPQQPLNQKVYANSFFTAFTEVTGSLQTATLSFSANQWVDLIGINVYAGYPNYPQISGVNVDGNSIGVPRWAGYDTGNAMMNIFDIAGYSRTVQLYMQNSGAFITMAPILPKTIISSGLAVVFPNQLAGQQVILDI